MDKNYRLWANLEGEGLAYFNGTEWETYTSEDGLPDDWFSDLLLADDDTLLASFDNGVVRRDPETGRWETISQLDDLSISAMHQASDGSLWFGGRAGAIRYDPETGDWQAFEARPGAMPDERVTTIIEDENGLWLGTDGAGVVFYDETEWKIYTGDDALAGNNVWAIRQDGSGALWFLHEDGDGLSRYDAADESWQRFGDDEGALDWPTAVTVDGDGTLWIGGQHELKWYDGRGWQTFAPDQLDDDTVFGVAFAPDGVRWLRTDAGVIRHDPATDDWTTFSADDHPVLEAVQALDVTRDGIVWAGGADGLVYYDQGSWSEPDAAGDAPTRDVDEIAEAPDGGLWVVADGALYNLADDYWARFNWPSDGWIETLAFGPDGAVWVGSDGLARFDPFSGDWQIFTTDDGLVYWDVDAIYVTPAGVVWVGTRGGVSRYVP
jgi:ligand-binding sensor domain-containing protein